jgi:hypothetical protein
MNNNEELTHHAMLVAWGQFAQHIGLIEKIEEIQLHQKKVEHSPQTKALEFFLAILGGLEHLKDLSYAAHPIEQDTVVSEAWLQPGWADYSGVSRCLSALTSKEAEQIVQALEEISQPILDAEVMLALAKDGELVYDGDLTGRSVSSTSTTYPGTAYGYMGDEIKLGYQAALVSFHSPTYGRFWLSSKLHPGDVVSCTQAEALVLAAEAKTGLRPLRRIDLLNERIQQVTYQSEYVQEQVIHVQQKLDAAHAKLQVLFQQEMEWKQRIKTLEDRPPQRGRRPVQRLAKARVKLNKLQRHQQRIQENLSRLEKRLALRYEQLNQWRSLERILQERLKSFEEQNQMNSFPISATIRMDAGFGSRENLALLIEMGYQVYTKPYSDWLTPRLKRQIPSKKAWSRVGANAEMIAWKNYQPKDFPYPLDVALERFYTGKSQRYGTLIHFGSHPVTDNLPGWFHQYNARQIIEAGIKEGKHVFQMHHLKVRSAAAIYLQEQFALFAANFVRWAARWLAQKCITIREPWVVVQQPCVKQLVQVAAHTSAWVKFDEQGVLLRFTEHSVYAGRSLQLPKNWAIQLALPFAKNACF